MSHLPPGIPSNLGEIEAAFLVGAMTCFALYGITCAQTVYYYRTYIGDHIFRKALVATLWVLETAHLVLIGNTCYDLYVNSKMPEKQAGLFLVAKPFAVSFALTVLMTSMVQSFYAWRVWAVSQSSRIKGLGTAAVAFILFASFVQFALGITSDVFLFVRPALPEIHSPRIEGLYSAQLAISMAGDVVISLSLVYFLNQSRSGFRATENIIDRLIIYSVNVGIVTSAISVVTFVVFHALPTKTHFTAFTEIISKLYVNSLLVTLNSRKSIRKVYDVKPSAESYAMVGSTGMGMSHVSHTKLGTVGMGSTVGKSAFNPGYSQGEASWYPSSKA